MKTTKQAAASMHADMMRERKGRTIEAVTARLREHWGVVPLDIDAHHDFNFLSFRDHDGGIIYRVAITAVEAEKIRPQLDSDAPLYRLIQFVRAAWGECVTRKRLGRSADEVAEFLEARVLRPARSLRRMKPKTVSGAAAKALLMDLMSEASKLGWDVSIADLQFMRGVAPDPKSYTNPSLGIVRGQWQAASGRAA